LQPQLEAFLVLFEMEIRRRRVWTMDELLQTILEIKAKVIVNQAVNMLTEQR